MGAFVAEPELGDGERVLIQPAANRSVANRGIGGRLYVTDRRFVFQPNVLYRFSRATTWELPFRQVAAVGDADRMLDHPFSGGLRKRLLIRGADGREELFVINHLEQLGPQIRDAVAAAGGTVGTEQG